MEEKQRLHPQVFVLCWKMHETRTAPFSWQTLRRKYTVGVWGHFRKFDGTFGPCKFAYLPDQETKHKLLSLVGGKFDPLLKKDVAAEAKHRVVMNVTFNEKVPLIEPQWNTIKIEKHRLCKYK